MAEAKYLKESGSSEHQHIGVDDGHQANSLIANSNQICDRYNTSLQNTELDAPPAYTIETTRPTTMQSLEKPVIVPATAATLGSPFLRAYAPVLENYNISRETFLNFIDDLNRVAVKNPPLQVLGLAGSMVGFVPLATAQIVGASINAASTIGTIAMSKGRLEMALSEANKQLFGPRGLKVAIGKLDAVAALAKIPSVLNSDGKVDKNSPILPSLENREDFHSVSGQQRRIQFLEPWIAHLQVDPLPEIEERSNLLSQLNVKASEAQRGKEEKKLVKERGRAHDKHVKESEKEMKEFEEEMQKLDKEEQKVRRKESGEKLEKELRKVEKEKNKVLAEHEKEIQKIDKDFVKDDKEQESFRKILFLVITEISPA